MGSAGEGGNELNAHHRAPPGDVAGSEPRAKGHRDASNGIAASIPIVVMPRYNAQTGSLPALAQAFGNEIVVGLSDVVRSTHP
ncbi:MAG: hypothetical protein Q8Q09_09900, partial [Deltaproteobacteria bacterium]|nr:hypothetical protein [Deltaproteobacteria bacterium]